MENFNKKPSSCEAGVTNTHSHNYSNSFEGINSFNTALSAYESALELAKNGMHCFPCNAYKSPACSGGFKAATAAPEVLKNLWFNSSASLVGVPTGKKSGFDVLDIDPCHGGDKWLEANRYRLPKTRIHKTRSGGLHILFNHREGLRCSASKIATGVDVRSDGGYIIWWPAIGLPIENASIADWPEWLIDVMTPKKVKAVDYNVNSIKCAGTGYVLAALRNAIMNVANAPEGSRNVSLNREAFSLARFIEKGELTPQQIANALFSAALAAGIPSQEIISTITSALRARGV